MIEIKDIWKDETLINTYKCLYCGTLTYEGDRNHWIYWDSNGAHCVNVDK